MKEPTRYPWFAIAAVLAAATAIYVLGLVYGNARLGEARRDALALQQARLAQAALRLEDYVGVTAQLARVASITLRDERTEEDVLRDVRRLLAASDRSLIYGVGVFYLPGRFHALARFGAYRFAVTQTRDAEQLVHPGNAYDYTTRPWYDAALRSGGKPAFTGPYVSQHGLTFLGSSESFEGRFGAAGVVLVEGLQSSLASVLARSIGPDDRAWVSDAKGVPILGNPAIPEDANGSMVTAPLHLAPWTLHLASTFPALSALRASTIAGGIVASVAYWSIVAILIGVLVRVRSLQLRAADLQETASRDALTGLRNRAYMLARLDRAIAALAADLRQSFAVLFVDLDRFAVVNDSLGHAFGDRLLQAIAERVQSMLPPGAEFGRIGGDEFVAFVPLHVAEECRAFAQAVIANLSQPFTIDDREIYISASIGIVLSAARYADSGALLRDADTAMYAAKKAGRGRVAVFDERMREDALARHSLEIALRRAIERREIAPMYQPIVELATGRVASVEALARWTTPSGEPVAPYVFIPLAEQCGIVDGIDTMVLAKACEDAARIAERVEPISMSVNVSATRLTQGDLAAKIRETIAESGWDPSKIKIELTETAIMDQAEGGLKALHRLRALGTELVIDDFGTGHSSLSYVQRLPVRGLKIDRSFVEPMLRDRQSLSIVSAIVTLAKTLGFYLVAEGVEHQEQAEKLRELGVDFAQGYYFSAALDVDALVAFLRERKTAIAAAAMPSGLSADPRATSNGP